MPDEMKEAVKKTMRRFPDVTFIWKYEKDEDNIGKDVPNLVTSSWVPQNDLLNHSKLAAFITHAGMNSLIEASHRGVPVVTIPLFGEQLRNGKMMKKVGSSVLVNKEQLFDSDVLETAIKEVLTNPTYAETAKRVSRMIAARPTSIKESLVKHVEFAAEFGQMPTFDPYGRKLNWFLYFSLDVISLGVIALCSSVVTIWMVLRTMVSKISVSKSKSE
ncbi:hypothetical protein L596_026870 [Steinernema carpocapsae]|uniref:glucuronosyltransferase n=1 Tax=Steinernema carpocapsae TaxID=34508 RepID=A0A4U5M2L8_STECR|nr:hypothetical protein L596_026870 [Steinernema carpocapsae]